MTAEVFNPLPTAYLTRLPSSAAILYETSLPALRSLNAEVIHGHACYVRCLVNHVHACIANNHLHTCRFRCIVCLPC